MLVRGAGGEHRRSGLVELQHGGPVGGVAAEEAHDGASERAEVAAVSSIVHLPRQLLLPQELRDHL